MKIISIRFKNINSLKGEHEIRFDQYPLQDSGIFAITGPTGSGKSTLLDVITLALFNQIPRFSKKINKMEITRSGSIVTHNTKEAFAQITYRVKNNEYTSLWSINQTKKGVFKDYEMTLYQPDGIPFDLKKSEIPAQNEALIGLKYQQFIKAILLSQGEFARFLKAKKNERGKLLEDITGTEIYRNLGKLCNQTYKDFRKELDEKRQEWEAIQTLSAADLQNLKERQQLHKKHQENANNQLVKLQKNLQTKQSLQQQQLKLESSYVQQTALQKQLKAFEADDNRLQQHNELQVLAVDFSHYQQAQEGMLNAQDNQKQLQAHLTQAEYTLEGVLHEARQLTGKQLEETSFSVEMIAFDKRVSALDNALALLKNKGTTERQHVNQKIHTNRLDIDTKIKPVVAIADLKNRIQKAKEILQGNGLCVFSLIKLDALQTRLATTRTELLFKNEWNTLLKQRVQIDIDLKLLEQKQQKLNVSLHNIEPLLQEKLKNVSLLKAHLLLLQSQKETAIKQASMEVHRAALKAGDACPLCGSEVHPFVEHQPTITSAVEKQLLQCQQDLETAIRGHKSSEKQMIEAQNSVQHCVKTGLEFQNKKQQLKEQFDEKRSLYTGKDRLPEQLEEGLMERLNQQIKEQERMVSTLQNYLLQQGLLADFEQLQSILKEHAVLRQERLAIYTGNSVKNDCHRLETLFNKAKLSMAKTKAGIDQEIKLGSTHELRFDRLKKQLNIAIKPYGLSSIEALNKRLLSPDLVGQLKQKKESLTIQKTQITTAIDHLKEQIEKDTAIDVFPEWSLVQVQDQEQEAAKEYQKLAEVAGKIEAQLERDTQDLCRIEKLQLDSLPQMEKVAKWKKLDSLIGDGEGNNFSNFAQALTLQNLLVYANKRIQKLTDRYLIIPPEKEGALRILDQYHGNISRSVATLSGGETFLVSLALALSLSDMASKTVSIDSLFIDEGFSTLDKEAQQMALDTLDNLQSVHQKTIGVISHVEALKSRIHVQIQLDKNAQGYSSLKVTDGIE